MSKILVVDDDPSMLDWVELHLSSRQHQVHPCNSASEAFDAIERDAPDVVLADLRTLGFRIPQTLRLTGWTHAGLAVMLLTGLAMFLSDTGRYLQNPAFQVKIALLAAALAAHFTVRRPGKRFAAILSLALWTFVVIAARAIADFDA